MKRRLFLTSRSPFARKVSLSLLEKGLAVEHVLVDLANRSPEFVAVSPIGKVPVLVDEDGTVVLDSTVICEYLEDRYPTPPLMPADWAGRLAVRQLDELGDTLAEQAITIFFGRGDTTKAQATMARVLDALEGTVSGGGPFTWADASVLSALGYVGFRLGEGWREGHPRLSAWYDAADSRPNAVATRPKG